MSLSAGSLASPCNSRLLRERRGALRLCFPVWTFLRPLITCLRPFGSLPPSLPLSHSLTHSYSHSYSRCMFFSFSFHDSSCMNARPRFNARKDCESAKRSTVEELRRFVWIIISRHELNHYFQSWKLTLLANSFSGLSWSTGKSENYHDFEQWIKSLFKMRRFYMLQKIAFKISWHFRF